MQYARNPKRDNTPRETTVKGPSFDNFEEAHATNLRPDEFGEHIEDYQVIDVESHMNGIPDI